MPKNRASGKTTASRLRSHTIKQRQICSYSVYHQLKDQQVSLRVTRSQSGLASQTQYLGVRFNDVQGYEQFRDPLLAIVMGAYSLRKAVSTQALSIGDGQDHADLLEPS